MVVRSKGYAAQSIALRVVCYLGGNRIYRNSLKHCLHCLLGIHSNRCLCIGRNRCTCCILPFLKLIAEVLSSLEGYGRTFLVLLQLWVACYRTSLSRRHYLSCEHILGNLCLSTYELSFDYNIRQAHLLGLTYAKEREVHLERFVGCRRYTIDSLRERSNGEFLATTGYTSVIYQVNVCLTCIYRSTDISTVSTITGSLEAELAWNK